MTWKHAPPLPNIVSGGRKVATCDDAGPGGLCTRCGDLHTVTVVRPCVECWEPLGPDDPFKRCLACRRRLERAGAPTRQVHG